MTEADVLYAAVTSLLQHWLFGSAVPGICMHVSSSLQILPGDAWYCGSGVT